MLALFAQGQNGPPPDAAIAGMMAFVGLFYCGIFVFGLIGLGLMIWLYIRMSRTLEICKPRNREMEPGMVWLNLVPLLGVVWLILSVLRVAESLQNEYDDRDLHGDGDFGKSMGITFYVTTIIGCFPINLIFLFLYSQKLAGYIEELESRRSRRSQKSRDDDDDRDQDDI